MVGTIAPAPVSFTLYLVTCRVTGSADALSITSSFHAGATALERDCVHAWQPRPPAPPPFTLDGRPPDGGDGTTVLRWSGLTAGQSYVLETGLAGGLMPYTVTMPASGDLTLWAVRYQSTSPDQRPVATGALGLLALLAALAVLLLGGAWLLARRRRR